MRVRIHLWVYLIIVFQVMSQFCYAQEMKWLSIPFEESIGNLHTPVYDALENQVYLFSVTPYNGFTFLAFDVSTAEFHPKPIKHKGDLLYMIGGNPVVDNQGNLYIWTGGFVLETDNSPQYHMWNKKSGGRLIQFPKEMDHITHNTIDEKGNVYFSTRHRIYKKVKGTFELHTDLYHKLEADEFILGFDIFKNRFAVSIGLKNSGRGGYRRLLHKRGLLLGQDNAIQKSFILSEVSRNENLFYDSKGQLWLFDGQHYGITKISGSGDVKKYSIEDGCPKAWIKNIGEDSQGNIWLGTRGGVSVFRNGVWTHHNKSDGLLNREAFVALSSDDAVFAVCSGRRYTDEGLSILVNSNDSLARILSKKIPGATETEQQTDIDLVTLNSKTSIGDIIKDGQCHAIAYYYDKASNLESGYKKLLEQVKTNKPDYPILIEQYLVPENQRFMSSHVILISFGRKNLDKVTDDLLDGLHLDLHETSSEDFNSQQLNTIRDSHEFRKGVKVTAK